jgi:amidase
MTTILPTTEITDLSADQLSGAIHARQLSCREVMQAYLRRIAGVNPHVNAIVSLQDERLLLAQADARDAQLARGQSMGWLHGMPLAIKDMSNTAGIPTTLGSPLLRDFVPQEDGLMVQRMKAAGCIVIGKTNVPEFGMGSHTFNEVFGTTRNPYDLGKTAGGSSGGAAVALATRMVPLADGSDFMGSLRNPAGWNNVFGFRPSQGRVPMWPASDAFISQLGTEGPMARTVDDLARLLEIQAGYDQLAPLSIANKLDYSSALKQFDSATSKIGWLGDMGGYLAMEDGILAVCEQALRQFEGLGCAIEPISLGLAPEQIWQNWLVWRRAMQGNRVAPFLKQPQNRALIKAEALWEHEQSTTLLGSALMAASVHRTGYYHQLCKLFEQHDFLALPTAQVWPFDAALRWPKEIQSARGLCSMDTYHRWMEVTIYATYAGLPCISVPAGFNAHGLPMGLQIIGKPQGDAAVLQLARAYEEVAQEVLGRRPPEYSALGT